MAFDPFNRSADEDFDHFLFHRDGCGVGIENELLGVVPLFKAKAAFHVVAAADDVSLLIEEIGEHCGFLDNRLTLAQTW